MSRRGCPKLNRIRRWLLAALVVLAATTAGPVLGAAAADAHPDLDEATPEHVARTYNQTEIERYAPHLVIDHLTVKPDALYGYKASSRLRETDVYVYFAVYTEQQGVTKYDSHAGDREPIYVFVNDTTGTVEKVLYSGYHWLRATDATPRLVNGTNPTYRVATLHHHYVPTERAGEPVRVTHLSDATLRDWLADDWGDKIYLPALTNPWVMETREHWWYDGIAGLPSGPYLKYRFLKSITDLRTWLDDVLSFSPGRSTGASRWNEPAHQRGLVPSPPN